MKLKKDRKFKVEFSTNDCDYLFYSNYINILPGILCLIDDYDNTIYQVDLEEAIDLKITELKE